MNAPDRLYLSKNIYSTFMYQTPDPDVETEVEYIRADAFIEKACDFIKTNIDHYIGYYLNDGDTYLDDSFIEDFKKYMEDRL